MSELLTREIWRLLLGIVLALGFGFLLGYPVLLLVVMLSAYIGWHLYNAGLVLNWIDKPIDTVPDADGIWAEIFSRLYRQKKRRDQRCLLYTSPSPRDRG